MGTTTEKARERQLFGKPGRRTVDQLYAACSMSGITGTDMVTAVDAYLWQGGINESEFLLMEQMSYAEWTGYLQDRFSVDAVRVAVVAYQMAIGGRLGDPHE